MLFRAGFGSPQPSPGGNVQKRLATPRNVAKPFWGCNLLPPLMPKWQGPPDRFLWMRSASWMAIFWSISFCKVGRSFTTSKWHGKMIHKKSSSYQNQFWLWFVTWKSSEKNVEKNHAELLHASGIRSKSMAKRPSHWALKCLGTKKIPSVMAVLPMSL